jgi:TolB-like protein/Tfp pilus assembly protein PilF
VLAKRFAQPQTQEHQCPLYAGISIFDPLRRSGANCSGKEERDLSDPSVEPTPEDPPYTAPGTAAHLTEEPPPVAVQASEPHEQTSVWVRIKQHKIAEWTLAYVAFAFALLHGTTLLSDALEWPHVIVRSVTLMLIVGLPITPIIAWYHGVRALKRVSGSELIIIALLLAIGASLLSLIPRPTAERLKTETASISTTTHAEPVTGTDIFSPPAHSVAVLPFVDMSEKKDQEYFSDGMSEELIDMLTRIPDLRVPARTSSFYFKGKPTTIAEIAKTLGVGNVLEGSVRRSGKTLRVTAQLIRVDTGYHVWSQTYDRKLDDIFKVQDEIAGAVVKALKVALLDGEAPSATLTTSSEAYEFYLQARSLLDRHTSDDALTAYADLQRAVRLDPKFALAWATLAALLSLDNVDWTRVFKPIDSPSQQAEIEHNFGPSWSHSDINQNWAGSWAQARAAAHAAAENAISFGPDLGSSHAAMGSVLSDLDRNWAAADIEFKKARELEPDKARITLAAAQLFMSLGRVAEALQLVKRAAMQDPLGHAMALLGYIQYISGDLDGAQVSTRKEIELYPTQTGVHSQYAFVLLARGEPQAALSEFERESAPQFRDVGVPFALDALGQRSDADRAIALAEQKHGNGMAWNIACFYGSRSESDRAFYWLERAYRQHDGGMRELKIEPTLRNLRRDVRYKALLHKMNLPE